MPSRPARPLWVAVALGAVLLAGCAGAAVTPSPVPGPAGSPATPSPSLGSPAASPSPSPEPASASVDPSLAPSASSGGLPSGAPTSSPSGNPPSSPDPTPSPPPATAPPVTLTAAWATTELVDVRTGQPFLIADFAGRTIFIEPMAIWCSKCLEQQKIVKTALAKLDPDRVVYISIGIDLSESPGRLASYSERQGFDWTFVRASRALARALAAEFGTQILNPPLTPLIVIGTDGTVTLTELGRIKSAQELIRLARSNGA